MRKGGKANVGTLRTKETRGHARSCDEGTWGFGHREMRRMDPTWVSCDGMDGDTRASSVELHVEVAMQIGTVPEMWVHGGAAKGLRISGVGGRMQAWVGSS